jgi:uncharacterized Tic20 family protein
MQAPAWPRVVGMCVISQTTPAPTSEERNWAMAAHLSALVAVAGLPFGHIVGPLVVYLTQRQRSAFVAEHARASLNFQITVSIAALILFVPAIGFWMALVIMLPAHETGASMAFPIAAVVTWILAVTALVAGAIAVLVFIIIGTVAASKDLPYRYPFSIDFVR